MRPPRSRNLSRASRAGCAVVPPWLTPVFFSAIPPNAISRSVFSTITSQDVERLNSPSWVPMTCGMMTPVAPRL
ncbi:Uncharacterised protein [Mycobacteroides abscessus subsp. abscessus]|nr:Uncharacterised protein [Mycobacteroides abscessus subsp. abscessus]